MNSPAPKRSRWRRIAVRLALLGIALSILVWIARRPIVRFVLVQAVESSGGELEFDALLGDFWSSIELQGVRYKAGEQTELNAEAIRLEYSIPKLISEGASGLLAVSTRKLEGEIRIEGSDSEPSESQGPVQLPKSLPLFELDVERLVFSFPDKDQTPIEIQKLDLTTDPSSPSDLSLHVERVLHGERAASISAEVRYENGRIQFDPIQIGETASLTGFVDLQGSETAWDIVATIGSGRLTTNGKIAEGARELEARLTAIPLRDLASLGRTPKKEDAGGLVYLSVTASDDGSAAWPAFDGELELVETQAFGFEIDSLTASLKTLASSEASLGSLAELRGEASVLASGLNLPGAHLDNLSAQLHFEGARFTLDHLTSNGEFHEFVARGEAVIDGPVFELQVDELSVRKDSTGLALASPAHLRLLNGVPTALSVFDLRGTAGHLQVRFNPATQDCVEVVIDKLTSNGLVAAVSTSLPEFEGLTGTGRACRTAEGWTYVAIDLIAERLFVPAAEFDCKARLRSNWNHNRLTLEELRFERNKVTLLESSGSIGINGNGLIGNQPLDLKLEIHVDRAREQIPPRWIDSCPVGGDLHLTVGVEGTPNEPRGTLESQVGNFALRGRSDPDRTFLSPTELSLRMRLDDRIVLEDLVWTGTERHQIRAEGTLDFGNATNWFEPEASERLQQAALNGSGTILTERLDEIGDWLRDWFGAETNLRSGHLEGQFALAGTWSDPAPTAHLRLSKGTLRTTGIPPITALDLVCDYAQNQLDLTSVSGELGAAPFRGTATLKFQVGSSPEVTATLRGEDLLLVRSSDAKARADLDLALSGTIDQMLVSGDVTLAQGRLVSPLKILDFNLRGEKPSRREGLHLFRLTDSPLKEMRFDINLRSRGSFYIDNNVIDGSVRPDLHLSGTGEVPTLAGTMYIDRTRVKLPANDITVRTGVVRFEEANPFFPSLELKGDARIKGYDVDITILGPYDNPQVVLSSTPPLTNEDLIVLVLAGQAPGSSAARTGRAAAQSVAVYLAKDFLAQWLSSTDPEDDASWIDRFDLQTGRDITRSGGETLEASFRLDEDLLREGDALYLTGESDQYDFVNFGLRIVFRFP